MTHVLCFCEKWESGGIESLFTSVYEEIYSRGWFANDANNALSIDILVCHYEPGIYDDRLAQCGLHINELSGSTRDIKRNLKLFRAFIECDDHCYDVVHLNLYEGLALLFAREARQAGISRIIVHSHNTDLRPSKTRMLKMMLHRACVHRYADIADLRWAPSRAAAHFLFDNRPWELLPNGIHPQLFAYSEADRQAVRSEFDLNDAFVIGCVGRLVAQKNQAFLIDVLAKLALLHKSKSAINERREIKLLLVGEGEDELLLRSRVHEYGFDNSVIFTGARSDMARLYQAMDVLCVPSLFEGLGIVAVEGQTAGLPVVCSQAVPPEAAITSHMMYCELNADAWSYALDMVCRHNVHEDRLRSSKVALQAANAAGYNIKDTTARIAAAYWGRQQGPCTSIANVDIDTAQNILVSVIVPVYQVAPYLSPCIKSLLAQTYRNLEIILVDDGSTDGGAELCDRFAQQDKRVRVIHQPNSGLSAARNAGLKIAQGEYVAFVDSDDIAAPSFIQTLLNVCIASGASIAQCGFIADEKEPTWLKESDSPGNVFEMLSPHEALWRQANDSTGAYTVVWNKLYRSDILRGIEFPADKQHEDEFVTYRLLWRSNSVMTSDAPLYYYRQRSTSTMGQGFNRKSLDAIEALTERIDFFNSHGEEGLALYTRATRCHRLRAMTADMSKSDEFSASEIKQLRSLLWGDYRAVMNTNHSKKSVGRKKKLALTLQMISPRLRACLGRD